MPLQSYCYLARPNQPSCLCNETIACHKQAEINVSCNLFESLKKATTFFAGYRPYKSRYSNIKPNEELKLTLKFETISSDLPAKLHLELCDQSGRVLAVV